LSSCPHRSWRRRTSRTSWRRSPAPSSSSEHVRPTSTRRTHRGCTPRPPSSTTACSTTTRRRSPRSPGGVFMPGETSRRRKGDRLIVESVTSRVHLVRTEHVNWVIYSGDDGVVLIDSGYLGQRPLLEESLRAVGHAPADLATVLVTHGHADHLGGATWLAAEYAVPVHAGESEVSHIRRDRIEQVGPRDVLRNALRPGVARWAIE